MDVSFSPLGCCSYTICVIVHLFEVQEKDESGVFFW